MSNEIICGEIGHFLQLPIPPYGITYFDSPKKSAIQSQYVFSSIDFSFERDSMPRVNAEACVQRLPSLCAGILIFDILVANPDRRPDNLWSDNVALPSRMIVFDHDHALMGGPDDGARRLDTLNSSLGLAFPGGNNYHCFLKRIDSVRLFDEWVKRIHSIPDWFLDDVCEKAQRHGMPRGVGRHVSTFLKHRRQTLSELIRENQNEFTSIHDWQTSGELFQ